MPTELSEAAPLMVCSVAKRMDFWQALPFGLTVRRSLKSYIQSNLSIRIFLVLSNASLFTIYEVNWQIGHGKWFTIANLILVLSSLLLSLTVPYCTKLRFTRNPTSEVTKVVAYFKTKNQIILGSGGRILVDIWTGLFLGIT